MIGFLLGLVYANAGEWLVHKYILHGIGRRRQSVWSFHWHEHHRACRQHDMLDPAYSQIEWGWNARTKEALALVVVSAAHLPLLPVAPFFTAAVVFSAIYYYYVHKRSHQDPEWARQKLPWHYDHHMGPNQNANWCVTRPLFDILLGTRRKFIGCSAEKE